MISTTQTTQMTHTLSHVAKQWISRAIALCVVGPMCAMLASGVIAPDGSSSTTFLTGNSLGSGAMTLAMVMGLVLAMGVAVGRLVDRRESLLTIAFVLGWVAWTTGRMGDVYRLAPELGTLIKLAIEAGVILVAIILTLTLMTNPNQSATAQGHTDEPSRFDLGYIKRALCSSAGMLSMGAAMIAAVVIAFLFGQTDLPGQSVGVGLGAGVAGGLAGALASTSARKDTKTNVPTAFVPIMLGVMLVGVLMPLVGLVFPGSGDLLGLVNKGDLPGYLIVSPIAWSMGALLGVPMGHSWVEHSTHQHSTQRA